MVEFDRSAFIGKFQEEAQDLLQRLNEGVITLEGDPENRELIDQMMRDAHTIKGSSRMVGLIEISDVAHWLEDIMVKVRDREMAYTQSMTDYFFEALDAIVYLTDNAGVNVDDVIDLDGLKAKLAAIAQNGSVEAAKAAAQAEASAPAPEPKPKKAKKKPAQEDAVESADDSDTEAGSDETDESDLDDGDDDDDDDDGESADIAQESGTNGAPKRAQRDGELKSKVQATIRIRTAQVDNLLNLISEVVISQIKAEQRVSEVRTIQGQNTEAWQAWVRIKAAFSALAHEELVDALANDLDAVDSMLADTRRGLQTFLKDYSEDVSRTSVVVSDLQEQGMRMRMLPANTIFQSFPRAIRDLAKQFNKEIDLIIEGGDTELDKKVLEEINDPLVHIMRNAADHGIEDP